MNSSDFQTELSQNLALRRDIKKKRETVSRVINMLESGKYTPENFYYVPFTGRSLFESGNVIHPTRAILRKDLIYLNSLLKSTPKNMDELKFSMQKEWTMAEIKNFKHYARRELNKEAKKMGKDPNYDFDKSKTKQDLIDKSDSLINHLIKIVRREPTRKNIILLLNQGADNSLLSGSKLPRVMEVVQEVSLKRLRYANNHYNPEYNPRDIPKLLRAYEDAYFTGVQDPLLDKVNKRLYDLWLTTRNIKSTKRR